MWHDEFSGATIDTTTWGFDLGSGFTPDRGATFASGWCNNELECHTNSADSAFVRNGRLHLRALRRAQPSWAYTSARMKTQRPNGAPLFAQRYGRFELRAKLPTGQGLWPAIWLLPQDNTYVCGRPQAKSI